MDHKTVAALCVGAVIFLVGFMSGLACVGWSIRSTRTGSKLGRVAAPVAEAIRDAANVG